MASICFSSVALYFLIPLVFLSSLMVKSNADLNQDFDITWGGDRGKILNNGKLLTLTLDNISGSGFQSKKEYLFGKIEMQLKLVPGNSAGTVTAYYMSSQGSNHDEIDFEFLGNLSGEPYTVHTNVYTLGKGEREQQFHLWFDPTADFHTYTVFWNSHAVVFSVDGIPIREFKNLEHIGVPFPKNQPMRLYSSIWNADQWATRGGLIKTNWSQAPFTASYRNFVADACLATSSSTSTLMTTSCSRGGSTRRHSSSRSGYGEWLSQKLDPLGRDRLRWVQKNYMIYNYCTDAKRFPQGFPPECSSNI